MKSIKALLISACMIFGLVGCSGMTAPGVNEAIQLIQDLDKITVLCNTLEGTSRWEPSEEATKQLKEWVGKLEYEEFNLLEVLDTLDIERQLTFNIDGANSFQYVTDSDGNNYIYVKDKWNKVINADQPPIDTAEFIRAELLGLNDIDNMSIGEMKEVIKVLIQNPNTEQSLKFKETLGVSLEEIADMLEGTEENNATTFSGVKVTEEDIKTTLKQIGLTEDMLDFSNLGEFNFTEATKGVENQLTQALDASTPWGSFLRDIFGNIYNQTKDDLTGSVDRSYYLIKEAVGKKTGKDVDEIDNKAILKYIEDTLKEKGYEGEDGYEAITELLDTIYESLTPEEQQLFRMYTNFTEGVGGYDLTDVDSKTIFNELIAGIRKELPPEQAVLLDMFMEIETVLENYDYTSKDNTLVDEVLNSLANYFTPEQQGVLRLFKEML